jgi:hypothetical protein
LLSDRPSSLFASKTVLRLPLANTVCLLLLCSSTGYGQPAGSTAGQQASSDPAPIQWNLEGLETLDGQVYEGLILARGEVETEFAEIVRPAGKPMFAVIRPVRNEDIADLRRLDDEGHAKLVDQFERFRLRARIEAGSMEALELERVDDGQRTAWRYTGPWFVIESTADEPMTRQCVVRVEQVFRAYRQLFPTRQPQSTGLRLLLLGSMDQYRAFLRSSGFSVSTSAFYSPSENIIVAGSDLNAFSSRLDQAREANERTRQEYGELMRTFPDRLASVLERMRERGYHAAEIEQEAKLRRTAWQRDYDAAMARLNLADYRNAERFNEVTTRMFSQLYHEAFHGYLANYVYTDAERPLPRWLNEGLAQIFETAQLDAGTLRVDAPDRMRLIRLQADLTGESPLPIAEVLSADEQDFITAHLDPVAHRVYLYSWGLAYYLAFDRQVLGTRSLDAYVRNESRYGPNARFVSLVGEPLDRFESRWRDAILALSPIG